jgi:hypothetical protein
LGKWCIDAYTTEILADRTTRTEIIIARLLKQDESKLENRKKTKKEYKLSSPRNTIGFGDCGELLEEMPAESVDLIFTSLPILMLARKYSEFEEYESYLLKP